MKATEPGVWRQTDSTLVMPRGIIFGVFDAELILHSKIARSGVVHMSIHVDENSFFVGFDRSSERLEALAFGSIIGRCKYAITRANRGHLVARAFARKGVLGSQYFYVPQVEHLGLLSLSWRLGVVL